MKDKVTASRLRKSLDRGYEVKIFNPGRPVLSIRLPLTDLSQISAADTKAVHNKIITGTELIRPDDVKEVFIIADNDHVIVDPAEFFESLKEATEITTILDEEQESRTIEVPTLDKSDHHLMKIEVEEELVAESANDLLEEVTVDLIPREYSPNKVGKGTEPAKEVEIPKVPEPTIADRKTANTDTTPPIERVYAEEKKVESGPQKISRKPPILIKKSEVHSRTEDEQTPEPVLFIATKEKTSVEVSKAEIKKDDDELNIKQTSTPTQTPLIVKKMMNEVDKPLQKYENCDVEEKMVHEADEEIGSANKPLATPEKEIESLDKKSLISTEKETGSNDRIKNTEASINDRKKEDSLEDEKAVSKILTDFAKNKQKKKVVTGRLKSGRRAEVLTKSKRGRYVRYRMPGDKITDIAIAPTVRAAAHHAKDGVITIKKSDIREKIRRRRISTLINIVFDTSGSMDESEKIKITTDVVLALLKDAYQRRDRVSLVTYSGRTAQLVLPFTSSVESAKRYLEKVPFGGTTPMASGMLTGIQTLLQELKREPAAVPIMILVTDGTANVPLSLGGNIERELLQICSSVSDYRVNLLIVDISSTGSKLAEGMADIACGKYYHPVLLSKETLYSAIKGERDDLTDIASSSLSI